MGGEKDGKPSVLVFETKGEQREGHDDTEYKEKLLCALEKTFNAGKMTIKEGPAKGVFRLVFDREGFPDAKNAFDLLAGSYNSSR